MPTISGTAEAGDTLSIAPTSYDCVGLPPISYAYKWSNGTSGTTDGTTTITDPLTSADADQSVSVTITATDASGSTSVTSLSVGPVTAAPVCPTPTISGTAEVGDTLSITPSPYTCSGFPAPTTTYLWSDGATGLTDTLPATDAGKSVSVTVTATNLIGPPVAATSAAVGPVTAPPACPTPTISGTAAVGDTLSITPSPYTCSGYPAPTNTYLWSDGTTGSTDTVPAADAGQNLRVTVFASNNVGTAATATSPPVTVASPPVNTSPPTISGIAQPGDKLTADSGKWSGTAPIAYTYLWSDGTKGDTDTLTAADVNKPLTVTVTATNPGDPSGVKATSASVTPLDPPTPGAPSPILSSTALLAPAAAVTNQTVTLIATVTSATNGMSPSGTLTFKNGTASISGCTNEPITSTGQSATVTCQTSFGASTAGLTAVFAPKAGSIMVGSSSATDTVQVARDSTSTSVDVSKTANVGKSTTYTATVTPSRPGPIEPAGLVAFLDNGAPIPTCINQPVSKGGATCTVTYAAAGTHSITARYGGDANFVGSISPAEAVTVVRPAAHDSIASTMQWEFYYTPTYTKVLALVVNGASGATVVVDCHGRGCPFSKHTTLVKTSHCVSKAKRGCSSNGKINLTPSFAKHRLYAKSLITVMITRRGWIGKYYLFTVRAGRGPRIRIACLAPGRSRPGKAC